MSDHIVSKMSEQKVMERQRPSPLASAAVICMTAALAASIAVAHEAKIINRPATQPGEGQMEQTAPLRSMDPAVTMPSAQMGRLVMPRMDPSRGKVLFVRKGCVACHAINGIGGHDAPNLDAHTMAPVMNPFDFAANMWNHAQGMIYAQEEAFGEQIMFTGEELADIIAFVHDDDAQSNFTERDLTPEVRKMMHHEHGGMPGHEAHAEEIGHEAIDHMPP